MGSRRSGHTATLLADGTVLVAGGWNGTEGLASAELCNPETGRFSSTGSMRGPRHGHAAVLLADGRVLVVGGWGSKGLQPTAELYDPATGTFAATGRLRVARYGMTATRLGDGRVLVAGGRDANDQTSSAELYDPATGTFAATGRMTEPRIDHTATLLADGRVLLTGTDPPGTGAEGPHATAELFDPATGTFTRTGTMAVGRSDHAATLLGDGRVLITGDGAPSAELYDPQAGTFRPAGAMTEVRWGHTSTLLSDGRVLIVGGGSRSANSSGVLAYAELYDPGAAAFVTAGWMADPRTGHTATALADGTILVAGGDTTGQDTATASAVRFRIDPGAAPSTAPPTAARATLPVRRSADTTGTSIAPGRDGRLYAAIANGGDTVLVALDARGRTARGWPLRLPHATRCRLAVDPADGSVRAACGEDGRYRVLVWGFDERGRRMPGWPVELPAGELPSWQSRPLRVVDGQLYAVLVAQLGDSSTTALVRISRDGRVTVGASITGFGRPATVGPDGTAYLLGSIDYPHRSTITALTLDGVRRGYPIEIDGLASVPAFGPDGRLVVVVEAVGRSDVVEDSKAQLAAFTPDGRAIRGWPVAVPFDAWKRSGDGGAFVEPPVVGPDGSVAVVALGPGWSGTVAYSVGPTGRRRAGWPFTSPARLVTTFSGGACTCMCLPCGCNPYFDTPPVVGPNGTLYLAQVVSNASIRAGRLLALSPGGRRKAGWPVSLREAGSWFDAMTVDARGRLYALGVEAVGTVRKSCGEKATLYAGTIVALDGHGDAIYTTTLIAP